MIADKKEQQWTGAEGRTKDEHKRASSVSGVHTGRANFGKLYNARHAQPYKAVHLQARRAGGTEGMLTKCLFAGFI